MAFVVADRVKETTATTGTGTLTLAGASTGFRSFSSGIGANNTTYYTISSSGAEWEVGIGTVGAGGTTLTRATVLASSNAGSLVSLSAGSKDVFVTYPAAPATFTYQNVVQTGNSAGIYSHSATIASNATIPTGSNGLSAGPITINSGVTVTVPSGSTWVIV